MARAPGVQLLLLLLASVGVACALIFLPIQEQLGEFLDWAAELGPWGALLLAALYVPATVLGIPGSLLTMGAGFAFGLVTGTMAVSVGSTIGGAAAFLVGRYLARGWVEEKLGRSLRFRALNQAVAQRGFTIVLLTRLSPVFPFTALNYAYSLTRVSFRDHFIAS